MKNTNDNAIEAMQRLEDLKENLSTLESFELAIKLRGSVTLCYKTLFIGSEKHTHLSREQVEEFYKYLRLQIPKVKRQVTALENKLKRVRV